MCKFRYILLDVDEMWDLLHKVKEAHGPKREGKVSCEMCQPEFNSRVLKFTFAAACWRQKYLNCRQVRILTVEKITLTTQIDEEEETYCPYI